MRIAELFDVRGLATIVTGGASGLGLACATVMAENGARVHLLDLDAAALSRAQAGFLERSLDVGTEAVDVSDPRAVRRAVDAAVARYGALDVLFANAGIGSGPGFRKVTGERNPIGAIEHISEQHWKTNIATNLKAVAYTLQAAVPHMKKQSSGGRIIVTTSVAAIKTDDFVGTPYIAAKAGAAHLVRQAALELARYKIRVNAIAPGSFLTNIGGGRLQEPTVRKRFENANPMLRMALPAEIQGLALYLASPASGYVTGTQMSVDGGAVAGLAEHEI